MRMWPMLLGLAACNQLLGVHDFADDTPTDGPQTDGSNLAECKVQRVVHVVAGGGGLAWFTIAWPLPDVIANFTATEAYDDPTLAMNVAVEPVHPLYARRIATRAIWLDTGTHPQPSVFVAGTNEVHSNSPTSTTSFAGSSIDAIAGALQSSLHPMYPVVVIGGLYYGTAPNAPAAVAVTTAAGALGLFTDPAIQDQVRPTALQLSRYLPAGGNGAETALANGLAFTANAFKLGLISTVMIPAFQDDPHGAFGTPGVVTTRGNNLALMLDAFYADLQGSNEPACGHAGAPLPLADNVVFVVNGDTFKNPYSAANWPDATPGNSNLLYVRSNGFLRPGWFGALTDGVRINFDPVTGASSTMTTSAASTTAAWAAMLYAIGRGDPSVVSAFTTAPYDGVIAAP